MKLEQQVCSLELAKKLKKLGVSQDGLFWWCEFRNTSSTTPNEKFNDVYSDEGFLELQERDFIVDLESYSAFTVAELGELIPDYFLGEQWGEYGGSPNFWKAAKGGWSCNIQTSKEGAKTDIFYDENEANSRAKMLIYLIENKLIEGKTNDPKAKSPRTS